MTGAYAVFQKHCCANDVTIELGGWSIALNKEPAMRRRCVLKSSCCIAYVMLAATVATPSLALDVGAGVGGVGVGASLGGGGLAAGAGASLGGGTGLGAGAGVGQGGLGAGLG